MLARIHAYLHLHIHTHMEVQPYVLYRPDWIKVTFEITEAILKTIKTRTPTVTRAQKRNAHATDATGFFCCGTIPSNMPIASVVLHKPLLES